MSPTKKRAQAALEFLVTYGWAFLVLIVMIAGLAHFGILDPSNLRGDKCMTNGEMYCNDAYVSSADGKIVVVLKNGIEPVVVPSDGLVADIEGLSTPCTNPDYYLKEFNGPTAPTKLSLRANELFEVIIDGCVVLDGERPIVELKGKYIPLNNELEKQFTAEIDVKSSGTPLSGYANLDHAFGSSDDPQGVCGPMDDGSYANEDEFLEASNQPRSLCASGYLSYLSTGSGTYWQCESDIGADDICEATIGTTDTPSCGYMAGGVFDEEYLLFSEGEDYDFAWCMVGSHDGMTGSMSGPNTFTWSCTNTVWDSVSCDATITSPSSYSATCESALTNDQGYQRTYDTLADFYDAYEDAEYPQSFYCYSSYIQGGAYYDSNTQELGWNCADYGNSGSPVFCSVDIIEEP